MVKDLVLKIVEVIQETPDTKTFRFSLNGKIDFKAGQFVSLVRMIDGKKVCRSYSISSSPVHRDYIDITFRVYPEGEFTPTFYRMKKGDTIKGKGSCGNFYFEEGMADEVVFIAGGTGIAPFMGMIRYVLGKNLDVKMKCIYSARNPEGIIFREELTELAEKNENLEFLPTITRPWTSKEKWKGRKGRIDPKFLKDSIKGMKDPLFFLCGPPVMVEATEKMLEKIGIKKERIKKERWH